MSIRSVSTLMWQTQEVLHKKPQIVPGMLLFLASSLVVCQHYNHKSDMRHDMGTYQMCKGDVCEPVPEDFTYDPLKSFLLMILVQMLPLVALEMRIMSCADPVGLFCKFATPVTLSHAFFLLMRLFMYSSYDRSTLLCSGVGFVGALAAMYKGYRQSWLNVMQCHTVWSLISLAFMAAISTTTLDLYLNWNSAWILDWEHIGAHIFEEVFKNANNYIEIVAFVPAVWIVFREDKSMGRCQVESADTQRTSAAFFLFLVGFYVTEDLLNAWNVYQMSALASLAYIVHFMLVLDFGCYVLAHIYNPEKLVGELRRWLPVDFLHDI